MGDNTTMTAEEFLKSRGEEIGELKSLFETSLFVSLDAMRDKEELLSKFDDDDFDH